MSNVTHDIVAKLWNLCNVLKDDGVTYHQYVTELTYLQIESGDSSQALQSNRGPIIFPEASVFLTVLWQSPPDVWIAKSTHGTQSISEPFPA